MNAISDALIITKRQLLQLARVPELILFSIIQPIMFVLLFRYVFGGSIDTGQPGGYVQLLMPGIFVQTVAFTLAGTAVGLTADMQKGLISRFRSLPISRSAVVFGRTLGDGALNVVVLLAMGITGYVVGWRPTSGLLNVTLGFVFLLVFGFAMSRYPSHRPNTYHNSLAYFLYYYIIITFIFPLLGYIFCLLNKEQAKDIAQEWKDKGYDDVVVEEVS